MKTSPALDSSHQMIENWIFTLIPVGVAFAFFMIVILSSSMANKGMIIVIGAITAFVGVEGYWVTKGIKQKRVAPILLGLSGIVISLLVLMAYMLFTGHAQVIYPEIVALLQQ